MEMSVKDNIGLSDLIRLLHEELENSQKRREAEGKAPLFRVANVDVEIQFIISSEKNLQGGFDIKVLSAEAAGKMSNEKIHKLNLHLESTSKGFDNMLGAYPIKE